MSKKKILVIHGFNSSPQSLKAQLTVQYMQDNYPEIDVVVPQLLSTPELAIKQLCQIIEAENNIDWYFTGSSLGGYFTSSDKSDIFLFLFKNLNLIKKFIFWIKLKSPS